MDLGGWNFVSAIEVSQVNAALVAQRDALIQSFSIKTPIVASGHYTDWRVVPGGSGKILVMEIGVSDGDIETKSGSASLAGTIITLQIRLDLLPAPGGGQQITFDLSTVTLQGVRNLPSGLGEITGAELGDIIAKDLARHADQVTFVLAQISPLAKGAPAWLAANAPDFAYLEPQGGQASIAIFANPNVGPTPALKLDPGVVGPNGFGLAISSRLFMDNVFRPALIVALGLPGNLPVSETANGNFSFNGEADLRSVSAAGESYTPKLTSLSAALIDDRVTITFAGHCDMGMDISMDFNGSSSVALSMSQPGTLAFSSIGPSSFDKDVHIPWYDHLLDIVAGVAEIILQVTVAAISSELSGGIRDVAGATALLSQAPNVVGWFGKGGFMVDQAGLAGVLWLHGKHN